MPIQQAFVNKLIHTAKYNKAFSLFTVVVLFGITGVVLMASSHAATGSVSIEAESGTLLSQATTVRDAGASGANAVLFNTISGSSTVSTCPAYPAMPNASCTGLPIGTTLKNIPGDVTSGSGWTYDAASNTVTIAGNNITFSGYRFDGTLLVKGGDGDIITKNSLSFLNGGNGDYVVKVGYAATNITISHNTIYGSGVNGPKCAFWGVNGETSGGNVGPGFKVIANNIYGVDHPIQSESGLYQDNYIHNICGNGLTDPATETHSDTFFSGGGETNQLSLIHNYLLNDDTSASGATASIMLNNAFGIQANRDIEQNLIGGGGFAIYGGTSNGAPASSNIIFRNNSFSTLANQSDQNGQPNAGYYGVGAHWDITGSGNIWTGNIWADGPKAGQTVPSP